PRADQTSMDDVAQVKDFLEVMKTYSPTIPEELVEYYLQQSGFSTTDPRIVRMIALVAHKFIVDATHDAMQFQRIRSQGSSSSSSSSGSSLPSMGASVGSAGASGGPSSSRVVLTMEDLAASLKEYGVNLTKPDYLSDVAREA
ncbi:TPA: hypothetical protein N0F65_013038, partial [Lagenidium giganteum]